MSVRSSAAASAASAAASTPKASDIFTLTTLLGTRSAAKNIGFLDDNHNLVPQNVCSFYIRAGIPPLRAEDIKKITKAQVWASIKQFKHLILAHYNSERKDLEHLSVIKVPSKRSPTKRSPRK
jgi:hypothetical protein